jgi:hypothetical protein
VKRHQGRQLVAPGEVATVPQWQKSKGVLIMTAALELSTNQVTHFYSEKKNTDEMIKLLDSRAKSTLITDLSVLGRRIVAYIETAIGTDRVQ